MSVEPLEVRDEASVSVVRTWTRGAAAEAGLLDTTGHEAAIVASELAHNLLRHGKHGEFLVRSVQRRGTPGIELVASDRGEGLIRPEDAFRPTNSTAGGLGVGLAAVRRMSHELDAISRRYEGTELRARFFSDVGPRRPDLGAAGRPHPDERCSGDDLWMNRYGDTLLIAVADGLGHGVEARQAAEHALAPLKAASPDAALIDLLEQADASCRGTRGAALTLVRLRGRALEVAGAGNVAVRILSRRDGTHRFQGQARVLGGSSSRRRAQPGRSQTFSLGPHDTLLVFTDGLRDRFDARAFGHLLTLPPLALAGWMVRELGRDTDDALAVVVR